MSLLLQSPKRTRRFTFNIYILHNLDDSGLGALKATRNTVSSTKSSPELNEAGWQHLLTADSPPAKRCREERLQSIHVNTVYEDKGKGSKWMISFPWVMAPHVWPLQLPGHVVYFPTKHQNKDNVVMYGLRLHKTRLHGLCQRSCLASHRNPCSKGLSLITTNWHFLLNLHATSHLHRNICASCRRRSHSISRFARTCAQG